jgi:hypothetical protein
MMLAILPGKSGFLGNAPYRLIFGAIKNAPLCVNALLILNNKKSKDIARSL